MAQLRYDCSYILAVIRLTSEILIKIDYTVHWRSKKQTLTATSTADPEINSMTLGLVEASWMEDIIREILGRPDSERLDLILDNDNQAFLANLDESLYRPGNRHLETKFHLIQE